DASPAMRAQAVEHALATQLVAPDYAKRSADDLAKLTALANHAALAEPAGTNKTPLGTVLDAAAIPVDKQELFLALFKQTNEPSGQFWDELATRPEFTPAQVATLRFATAVGTATRGHLPLVKHLLDQRRSGQIKDTRDLARLDAAA